MRTLLSGLDIFWPSACFERGDALAGGVRAGAEGISAAGGVVESLARNVAGLGEGGEAGGGGSGRGEVGFGGAEVGARLGDFLGAGAKFSGGEQGAGLGGRGFGLGDLFRAKAAGELVGAGGGFSEAGFGLAQAGAEFGKIEADEGGFWLDDCAFLSQDFGDSSSDLRANFHAARFDHPIDGEEGRRTVRKAPPARGGGRGNEKERQAAGDHVPKAYSKR